jgi:glycosyltransferase involved in cell wall biosynthesis
MRECPPEAASSGAVSNAERNASHKRVLRLSLCLLTWNEIEGCRIDLPRIASNEFDEFEEIYAVDAGSTDGTVEYLLEKGIPVHRQPVRGYNQAYICAFEKCTTDALIIFHPKGNIDPGEINKFRLLLEGHDLVIASRMVRGARNEEDHRLFRPRKWFVLGLAVVSAMIWRGKGSMIWDVLHGFRAMRREAFFAIDPLPAGLSIDLEMVVRCYRRGLQMVEFPITEHGRGWGETHFKAFPTGKAMLRYLMRELRRDP